MHCPLYLHRCQLNLQRVFLQGPLPDNKGKNTVQRKQVKIQLSQHFYVLSLMLQVQSASREHTKRSGLKAELKAESQSDLLQAKPKQTRLLHRPQKQGPVQVHKREDFVHTVATFCKREYCEAE